MNKRESKCDLWNTTEKFFGRDIIHPDDEITNILKDAGFLYNSEEVVPLDEY